MTAGWVRATQTNQNNSGFFGSLEMIGTTPGQTILHTFWNINIWGSWGSVAQYPPGSSICRVGLVFDTAGIAPASTPTPITNASADWLDITTLCPVGQIATSTNVDWQYNWQFEQDREVTVKRKNTTAGNKSLYMAWEFTVASDALSGFTLNGWSSSIDAYVNTP